MYSDTGCQRDLWRYVFSHSYYHYPKDAAREEVVHGEPSACSTSPTFENQCTDVPMSVPVIGIMMEKMETKAGVCVDIAGTITFHSFGSRHGQYRLSSYKKVARCNITLDTLY